jgi:hypothetical protein
LTKIFLAGANIAAFALDGSKPSKRIGGHYPTDWADAHYPRRIPSKSAGNFYWVKQIYRSHRIEQVSWWLKPPVVPKAQVQQHAYRRDRSDDHRIAVGPFKLRHVLEVHAVNARYRRRHGEYGRPSC